MLVFFLPFNFWNSLIKTAILIQALIWKLL